MARRSRRSTNRSRNRARARARAQAAAKSRRAQGRSISQTKSANKASMRKAAAARHAKFKQTRVQTFGGKKTSFSKAEQKRITNAGYNVQGYSKAAPRSNTQLQVDRDNRMYGNTVPAGSFGISAAGRAQAAANRAEAAAKAKKEATRKSTFDPNRALNYAKGLNLFNTANIMAPGGNVASWYNTGADPTKTFRQVMGDEISMSQRTQGVGKGGWNPLRGMPGYGTIRNVLTGKPWNAKFEGGFETGPTEANRRVFNNLSKAYVAGQLFKQGQTGSITDQIANETIGKFNPYAGTAGTDQFSKEAAAARERGPLLSIGNFKVPEFGLSEYMGINTANRVPKNVQVASTEAGGLNISGGGVDSGEAKGSKTGRTVNDPSLFGNFSIFTGNILKQPKAALAYGADVISQAFAPRLGDGTLKGNMDFAGNLPGDKGFDNRDVQIKSAVNNAMDSRFVQQYGENLGLPKNFKAQTKDALAALGENYQGATADRDGIYKGTSETLKNLSSDKRLAPIAKFLNQLGTDNENVTDADRNKKFSAMGFQTPFTNEQVADAITAFQPNVAGMPGLSRADRGLIEGSGGNRIISGKLTDIAREAITGNIGTGDSLGLQTGTPLTIGNMLDAGNLIASNYNTEGTLANQRSAEIANLANQAGKITTPSLIKGLIPRFGGRGSFRPNAVSSLGGGATTLAAATPTSVEEVLPLPTTITQTGTDSSNLASIMQNAYANQMSLYGMNPNYFANIRQPRFNRPTRRFRDYFRVRKD